MIPSAIMVLTMELSIVSFTDLIIESDNLELFKLYAVYSVSKLNYTLAKHGAIKILNMHMKTVAVGMEVCVLLQPNMDI